MKTQNHRTAKTWLRRSAIVVGTIVALVVLVGLIASPVATWALNRKLSRMPDVTGHVDRVGIQFFGAVLSVNGFELRDRTAKPKTAPLIKFSQAVANLSVGALFKGKLRGSLQVEEAAITLRKKPEEQANKKFDAKDFSKWRKLLRNALPIQIASLEVKDSSFRFVDATLDPTVDVAITQIQVHGKGLLNRDGAGDDLPTHLELHGMTTGDGDLQVFVDLDPIASPARFRVRSSVKHVNLPAFNDFLRAYEGVDVSSGTFESFLDITAKDGRYTGYIKPFVKNANFKSKADENDSLWQKVKEGAADVAESIFENDSTGKTAARIPISGKLDNPGIDVWTTIDTLLRNAFIQALKEGFARA